MRRVLAVLAASLVVFGACGSDDPPTEGQPIGPSDTAAEAVGIEEGAPPWPLGGNQAGRMVNAGIEGLTAEGDEIHYHAHLDVFYDGKEVKVPGNIGIDLQKRLISPLHTHTDSGVVHVEAEKEEDFTLGQFFTEWGVKVGQGCFADKCGDEVALFVDGSIQDTPAASHVIKGGQQITLVLGTERPADIPSTYDCKAEDPRDFPCAK